MGLSPGKSKVFKPDQLLSEAEAAKLVGIPKISLDQNSLEVDWILKPARPILITSIHFQRNASRPLPPGSERGHNEGEPDKRLRSQRIRFLLYTTERRADILSGLGDKAFFYKTYSRVYVLYGNYFFMTAFKSPTDDDPKNRDINIAIARHIIENIKKK